MSPLSASRVLTVMSTVLGLGLAAALAVPQATAAPSAPAAAPAATAPSGGGIDFGRCDDQRLRDAGAKCGLLSVPLDYDDPSGERIKIAVSRLEHTSSQADYNGPLFFNPGGPGGSGLIYPLIAGSFPANVRSTYDFIGFDPRGVGSSVPSLSCDNRYTAPVRPRYTPRKGKAGRADVRAWMKKTHDYTDKCADKNDADLLDNLTTEDVANDVDRIREALGAPQLSWYGFSYGTYIGQVYSSLFPTNVRRMVFDGTVDPRAVWYDANLSQDVAFETTSQKWFGWIADHNGAYGLGRTRAAVSEKYYDTLARLDKKPDGPKGARVGGSEWSDTFLYAGYYDSFYPQLAQVFSDYVNKDAVGELRDTYLSLNGPGNDNGYAVYLGTECTDTSWPQSWKKWKRDNTRIDREHPFLTWGNAWFNEPCRHWPGEVSDAVEIDGSDVDSVLMVNEEFDAATPFPGSLEVRSRYPGARLIEVDGGVTHSNSLAGNQCVDGRIFDYLADGTLPKRKSGRQADVHCTTLPHPSPRSTDRGTFAQRQAPGTLLR